MVRAAKTLQVTDFVSVNFGTHPRLDIACCRTGDEKAATFLFDEMVRAPGFRPRVPPYNTMMQFYIATQPSREKALSYFDAMLRARVAPTGHTYKLLLDAYGSIQDGCEWTSPLPADA